MRQGADSLLGQTLDGRYRLVQAIGRGGMGVVYEAEHVGLGKRVAVKVLLDEHCHDVELWARFRQEARSASLIGHENIIDVLDVGEHLGRAFITMELLRGADLRRACEGGGLPIDRALPILAQVCRGLAAAHAKGVIHRDMKPENVFLIERFGPDFVKLMDFGISKIRAGREGRVRLTHTGAVVGTPLYMAPEQALGQVEIDQRVDVYAVGVMAYEILVGRPPFQGTTYASLLTQHLHERPVAPRKLRADLPPRLDEVILRALEKNPDRRWPTIEAMGEALGSPARVSTPRKTRGSRRKGNTRIGVWIGGIVLLAAGVTAGVLAATARQQPAAVANALPPPPPPALPAPAPPPPAAPPTPAAAPPAPQVLALPVPVPIIPVPVEKPARVKPAPAPARPAAVRRSEPEPAPAPAPLRKIERYEEDGHKKSPYVDE